MVQSLGQTVRRFMVKSITTLKPRNSSSKHTQEKENVCPQKTCARTFIASLFVTEKPVNKPNVSQEENGEANDGIFVHRNIMIIIRKTTDIHININESQEYYIEQDTDEYILFDSLCKFHMKFKNRTNLC